MDSPESSKLKTTNPAETAPVQESPVFSYISNLSPIQTAKASSVAQGFPGLNSPPLVFTSPRLNTRSQSTFLKREVFPRISSAKLNEKFESVKNSVTTIKGHGELDIQSSSTSVASCEKATDSSNSVDELILSPSGSHEQFLEDIVNVDSLDPKFSFDSAINKSEYNDQPTDTPTCSKEILISIEDKLNTGTNEEIAVAPPVTSRQTEEVKNEITLISVCATENFIKQGDEVSVDHCPKIEHELPAVDSLVNQDEDKFMNENAEAGETATLDQSSYLLTESKAFQNRGARRRCLQFGDAQHNAISNRPVQDPSDGEADKSPSLETPSTPIDWKLYPTNTMDSSIKIPTPSGIGLHLNRIVNTAQSGSATKIHVKATQLETTDGNKYGSHHACGSDDSASAFSTHIAKPANDSVILNSKAEQSTIGNKRKIAEKSSGLEEINKLSPQKKRKKPTESGDGCQRCNCKRSKCLKLYCDCFAAGIYCAEPCACQECFNRPEYEDRVIETRQKIETRDPFAFAPRVVQHIVEQPTISCGEDGSNFTPASARHKKGCKCKKSMCLKKYCECYQANVGCSDGCRCEGCKNVFGQKGEYGMTKVVLTREDAQETTDASYIEDCEITAASQSHTYHPEFVNPHHLSPPTPAFEFSNHGKEASKARFPSGKYSMTPESGFTYVAPYVLPLCSPITSENNVTLPESAKDLLDMDYFDQESHHGNAETVDEFSAAYPQSGKMHLSDIPNLQKWADNSKGQSKRNYLWGSSLGWRGSPITPMAQFSGIKTLHEVGFDFELSNTGQDDSPEILRNTSTPLNIVKASSPNKKRVSPPHGQFITSTSAGTQTGRKFILRAIPSFPPLTPCVDSKALVMQRDNIPENHCDNE